MSSDTWCRVNEAELEVEMPLPSSPLMLGTPATRGHTLPGHTLIEKRLDGAIEYWNRLQFGLGAFPERPSGQLDLGFPTG